MNEVYELVDVTSSDVYYPLGLFRTFYEAKDAVWESDPCCPMLDGNEDYEVLEIRKRTFGLSDTWKVMATIERRMQYDDDQDKYVWRVVKHLEPPKGEVE